MAFLIDGLYNSYFGCRCAYHGIVECAKIDLRNFSGAVSSTMLSHRTHSSNLKYAMNTLRFWLLLLLLPLCSDASCWAAAATYAYIAKNARSAAATDHHQRDGPCHLCSTTSTRLFFPSPSYASLCVVCILLCCAIVCEILCARCVCVC